MGQLTVENSGERKVSCKSGLATQAELAGKKRQREEVDEAEEAKVLSDRTQIAATTWKNLKPSAMADDYQTQSWFVSNFLSF